MLIILQVVFSLSITNKSPLYRSLFFIFITVRQIYEKC